MITFYGKFINIIDYISLSEIIFSFTDDIFNFFKIAIVYVLGWIFNDFIHAIQRKEHTQQTENSQIENKNYLRNIIIIIAIAHIIGIVIGQLYNPKIGYVAINYLVYLTILYVYFMGNRRDSYAKYLGVLIVFFFTIKSDSDLEAEYLKQGISTQVVEIRFQNEIITSDSSYVYLGKTEEYLFFYNRNNQSTTVYKNDEVSMIRIKGKI